MDGFLNINKPVGLSSARVVAQVKRMLGGKIKVGHMGTLDPMATGVLPIAVGKATRLFEFLLDKTKTYEAIFKFGEETDTLDREGKVVKSGGRLPSEKELKETAKTFVGRYAQTPPIYSAKLVAGRRAYDLARAGVEVVLTPKEVEIFEFELVRQISESEFLFKMDCSSGTYVRALGRDLAYKLSTYCTTQSILRTKSGVFELNSSVGLENVTVHNLLPMDMVLADIPQAAVSETDLNKLLNGVPVTLDLLEGLYKLVGGLSLRDLPETNSNEAIPSIGVIGLLNVDSQKSAKITVRLA
ncbi:MAG: tRNA pseudouridine(55) synthase TruB [Firmicutes bacterium]|nr:tRNA pseudouridine(55) synthase TruB [Bacillota bacterium]